MVRSDLHVHSRYSNDATQWLMQHIGTQESYTSVDEVYTLAKNRGMDFVTMTDHDSIAGALKLKERYPADTFVSVESTAYFPEDGCKIHILVYDLTEGQFHDIQRIRSDIYDLRAYFQEEQLAHSVGHATYSINGKLAYESLEKLLLLFDVFEGINGSRHSSYNTIWRQVLMHLTSDDIERLYQKHRIEPCSDTPWLKGVTGGTDDHAGLFIGQTFTVADCATLPEFLRCLKAKQTRADGRTADFKSIAFAFYKVACDFSRHSPKTRKSKGLLGQMNRVIFENKRPNIRTRLAMKFMKRRRNEKLKIITRAVDELVADFLHNGELSVDEKIDKVYDSMAVMTDDFLTLILESIKNDFRNGDIPGVVTNFSAILPAIFLSAPFFSTLRYMSRERKLSTRLKTEFLHNQPGTETRTLCFSDTGGKFSEDVLHTLQHLMNDPDVPRRTITIVGAADGVRHPAGPFATLNLPNIYTYTPEFSRVYTMRVASVLKSLELIDKEDPDEILILTPGPIGLLGVMAAKLLGIRAIGLYHTDYSEQARNVLNSELWMSPAESYIRWFYSFFTEIYVPTREYFMQLGDKGINTSKIKIVDDDVQPSLFPYSEPYSLLFGET